MRLRIPALAAVAVTAPFLAAAQGIDCTRARSPVEKATCASPALRALDGQVAGAYADALARQPDQRDALRADLSRWLKARDAACNLPAATIERCLSGQLTTRLAALAPPAAAAPLHPAAGPAVPPPDPALPAASKNPPAPAATLDAASLPAAAEADTLLYVTSPGRFTLAAHSPAGAALQLVDMLTGPTEVAGIAGARDGRLDKLLDIGIYKLRVFSAPGASGPVALTATPFHDAAPPAALPPVGRTVTTTLRDGEQRAFWLLVPPGDGINVRIEAAGRSLGDLLLWRDGRELTALEPTASRVASTPAHPLDDLRLTGHVEPGTYLAVAYGGPALPWTDSADDQPFYLRSGASPALLEGIAAGTVSPFGSELFVLPGNARLLRLDLPAPAAASLRVGDAVGVIEKASREPHTVLQGPQGANDVAEVSASAGQPFTLRALERSTAEQFGRPGTWWIAASTTGTGGDELPPTLLLQKRQAPNEPLHIVASTAPRIGANAAWHGRFNLRGPSSLLFQLTAGGDVAFTSTGVAIRHGRGSYGTMPADFYRLNLEPQTGALGSLEVTVGSPGAAPTPLARPLPPDPVIPFGIQTLTPGQYLVLDGVSGTDVTAGLVARRVPVVLAEGPVTVTIAAGDGFTLPVQVTPGGTLTVSELGAGPIAFGQQDGGAAGRTTVVVPVSDHARTVSLGWRRTVTPLAAIPAPTPPGQVALMQAGTPVTLDLRRGEERGFALSVPQGGLFRLETLGRLHTSGRLATAIIPDLAHDDGGGAGQNMLIQSALRAGRYRVDVKVVDSAGHLSLLASPAALAVGGALRPGGSVRASLPAGAGVAFPVEITGGADDRYHLEVLSQGQAWTGRLEDAEGWPVIAPGTLDGTETALRPGQYRIVVTPGAVARQIVMRLTRVVPVAEITGHGPHRLPFEVKQAATWREPDSRDRPRDPDAWTFTLAGSTAATITLSDGMTGDLHRAGDPAVTARVVGTWSGTLEAGDWLLDARSLGRNDRLAYRVGLSSPDLQAGAVRTEELPATLHFTLASPLVVSLASWGDTPVKASLSRDGAVMGRFGARPDDWNIAISRLLPAGRYTLAVQSAAPPGLTRLPRTTTDTDREAEAAENDDQDAQTSATKGAAAAPSDAVRPPTEVPDSVATTDDAPAETPVAAQADAKPTVEIGLSLFAALPAAAAPDRAAVLDGVGVHVLTLPKPAPGTLVVAAAGSTAPVVLALERQDGEHWQTVALAIGRGPVAAAPADDGDAAWRVEAWALDGGPDPIRLTARAVTVPGSQPGPVMLAPLDGMPGPLAAARVSFAGAGMASVGARADLLVGGWAGHALTPAGANAVVDGQDLWLLASQPASVTVEPLGFARAVTLSLPAGLVAHLPASPAQDGHVPLWRVASGAGQPSLGVGSAVADGDAVALAATPLTLRGDGLRLLVSRLTPALAAARDVDAALQVVIPPGTALPLRLPAGDKAMELGLAPGVAAFAGWHDALPAGAWGGSAAVSRTMNGDWTELLLVNTGASPAPARVTVQPAPAVPALQPGTVLKRFYGAAGSFDLPFAAPAGAHLLVAGDAALTAVTPEAVARGTDLPVAGSGRAVVQHGPGAVAVWLEAPGASPWPDPASQALALPARLALSGPATALTLTADRPMLLHAATTAPVLAGLQQQGRTDAPALFAAGAELHRAVAAGPVTLRLFSADDGALGGTLTVWAEPILPLGEGLGDAVAIAPGGSAAWGFTLAKTATIGVGIRAEPDQAQVRVLDASGAVVGEGVAQLRSLPAGRYVLEARVPPSAPPTVLRPALVGITPRGNGPPPDVAQGYLELVGMRPAGATR